MSRVHTTEDLGDPKGANSSRPEGWGQGMGRQSHVNVGSPTTPTQYKTEPPSDWRRELALVASPGAGGRPLIP
jgi:hypothetical protein